MLTTYVHKSLTFSLFLISLLLIVSSTPITPFVNINSFFPTANAIELDPYVEYNKQQQHSYDYDDKSYNHKTNSYNSYSSNYYDNYHNDKGNEDRYSTDYPSPTSTNKK